MGPIPFVPVSSLGSSRGRAVYNVRSAFGVICSVFWFERVVAPRPGGVGRPGTRARNPKTASLKDTRVYARRGAGARPAARGAAVRTASRSARNVRIRSRLGFLDPTRRTRGGTAGPPTGVARP